MIGKAAASESRPAKKQRTVKPKRQPTTQLESPVDQPTPINLGKPKTRQPRAETRGGTPTLIRTDRPEHGRTLTIRVDAETHAFLADYAVVNGTTWEEEAESILADVVRDTLRSEAA
ncbi:MAG: hypothetical protein GC201_01105 [Alphaproteobacteria bacterium]|nr:hypothetical protein [Alphaproteobacteria bacterium]